MFSSRFYLGAIVASFLFAACTQKLAASSSAETGKTSGIIDLAVRGQKVYSQNCITCHNPDPKQAGAVGPAIAGSSLQLITARVLHGTYPDGYNPKRDTRLMPPIPALAPAIPVLHAFLNK